MIIAAGPISEVHVRTTKRNKKYVRFAIHGHPVRFSLSDADPGLPKIEYLIPMLHPGVKAEVHYGPDGPRDIWSLRIGDQLLLTPAIAYNERKAACPRLDPLFFPDFRKRSFVSRLELAQRRVVAPRACHPEFGDRSDKCMPGAAPVHQACAIDETCFTWIRMGSEYKIIASLPSEEDAERILRNASHGASHKRDDGYEYRSSENQGSVPDAYAKREPDGFYFCAYDLHGISAEALGFIVASVAGFGPVQVEALE